MADLGARSAGLFSAITSHPDIDEAVSDEAMLRHMLEFERSLALACARAGVVPAEAATAIARVCTPEHVDVATMGRRAESSGSLVIPLVSDLGEAAGPAGRAWVHRGATSQDVVDTASSLMTRDVGTSIVNALEEGAKVCAALAESERSTIMAGRTLGQHALPTTFGLKAAGWTVALWEVHDELSRVLRERTAVQLGGAAGTLASLGGQGPRVAALMAADLGLCEPTLPWHSNRMRIAVLSGALAAIAGVWGKIALDLVLMSQTEIAEIGLAQRPEAGSSAMPHKVNPVGPVRVRAAAIRVPGLVSSLLSSMHQEHERGAGTWQAELVALRELLRATGAVALHGAAMVAGIRVDAARMLANLELTRGATMSERLADRLAPALGRAEAHTLVRELCARVAATGEPLATVAGSDGEVTAVLGQAQIDELMNPAEYLGAAQVFVDRALAMHRERVRATRRPASSPHG